MTRRERPLRAIFRYFGVPSRAERLRFSKWRLRGSSRGSCPLLLFRGVRAARGRAGARRSAAGAAPVPDEPPPAVTSPSSDADPLSQYEVVSAVGRGKFSTVYKARRRADGCIVALKRIRMGAATTNNTAVQEKCLKEVRLLQSLDHGNIIRYLDSFAVHPNTLVIVLEWATDGDLQCHLRRIRDRGGALPEPVIWQSFVQICEALAHMHERRILHRDLKPANIFLHRDGTIKVGDLGLKTLRRHPRGISKVGTPLYMSPEALRGDRYDTKSDIWSLGCVLYELAMLRSPFRRKV